MLTYVWVAEDWLMVDLVNIKIYTNIYILSTFGNYHFNEICDSQRLSALFGLAQWPNPPPPSSAVCWNQEAGETGRAMFRDDAMCRRGWINNRLWDPTTMKPSLNQFKLETSSNLLLTVFPSWLNLIPTNSTNIASQKPPVSYETLWLRGKAEQCHFDLRCSLGSG